MKTNTAVKAIETVYAGYRFRSRLEARWAVFFDAASISWRYEPQGYLINGQPYLPDFFLPSCGTWIEVKGDPNRLDCEFMNTAAQHLPLIPGHGEDGPRLMILGDIPPPLTRGDWGWIGLRDNPDRDDISRFGFGTFYKNSRPWFHDNEESDHRTKNTSTEARRWLTPTIDPYEHQVEAAYTAARQARFEHGERP